MRCAPAKGHRDSAMMCASGCWLAARSPGKIVERGPCAWRGDHLVQQGTLHRSCTVLPFLPCERSDEPDALQHGSAGSRFEQNWSQINHTAGGPRLSTPDRYAPSLLGTKGAHNSRPAVEPTANDWKHCAAFSPAGFETRCRRTLQRKMRTGGSVCQHSCTMGARR